jgi:hypothetical protein
MYGEINPLMKKLCHLAFPTAAFKTYPRPIN